MADTDLVLSPIGIVPYSARGLHQTLEPIQQAGVFKRTVLGDLDNVASPVFQKYKSSISCEDLNPPGLNAVFPGFLITVDCIAELAYLTSGGSALRTPVSTRTEGVFTLYRPRLVMQVISWNINRDEWGVTVSWQLDLEES